MAYTTSPPHRAREQGLPPLGFQERPHALAAPCARRSGAAAPPCRRPPRGGSYWGAGGVVGRGLPGSYPPSRGPGSPCPPWPPGQEKRRRS